MDAKLMHLYYPDVFVTIENKSDTQRLPTAKE